MLCDYIACSAKPCGWSITRCRSFVASTQLDFQVHRRMHTGGVFLHNFHPPYNLIFLDRCTSGKSSTCHDR